VFGTLTALGLVLTLAALLTSSRSKEDGHGLTRPLSEAHAGRRRTTAGVNEREARRRKELDGSLGPAPDTLSSPSGSQPTNGRRTGMGAFAFKLECGDGTPADPPSSKTTLRA
jgi:hypothetical protein